MKELKDRIIADGVAIGTEIVKVDSFLNHQIDVELLDQIGQEFAKRFQGCNVTKILTVEASGIAVACMGGKILWEYSGAVRKKKHRLAP